LVRTTMSPSTGFMVAARESSGKYGVDLGRVDRSARQQGKVFFS
jgi:hypothetical protein